MRRRGTHDLNVQTMQTYGRDLYESIGETKVAGINREFSPTGTTRGDRFILVEEHWKYSRLFLSLLKKKKEFSSTMNERTQKYSPRDSSIKGTRNFIIVKNITQYYLKYYVRVM